ncbi:hypothetical protein [Antrihabitans stalactiti]|uniref:Uncharacterized protein n=1 Tax=Antrihabitans stalactiti TaxID=2584121 RepID=A0A848KAZ0_9NOCA|nr:hypothetical protein [Antrihabitans stalactiti]NMN96023.1 hypothetical protein [Antrihabitans stalactiti]
MTDKPNRIAEVRALVRSASIPPFGRGTVPLTWVTARIGNFHIEADADYPPIMCAHLIRIAAEIAKNFHEFLR